MQVPCVPTVEPLQEEPKTTSQAGSIPEWLENTPWVNLLLALLLMLGVVHFAKTQTLLRAGLNEMNTLLLCLGLVAHGSPARFIAACERAAGACSGVIVQFPLYAAVIAVMTLSGLVGRLAEFASAVPASLLPASTFFWASVINLFVPSGGGQWAVQGPIALEAGARAGIPAPTLIMAVAYGDQLTNMLQPFWALPLLAITKVRARDIVGYTAIVMVVGAVWIAACLTMFTALSRG
jgi:short-chain fatty acids transporter